MEPARGYCRATQGMSLFLYNTVMLWQISIMWKRYNIRGNWSIVVCETHEQSRVDVKLNKFQIQTSETFSSLSVWKHKKTA